MKTLINKIKGLRSNGREPCDASIEFLKSCKTPQEAFDRAPADYLEWLLDALKVDFKKEEADYYSKRKVLRTDYNLKRDAIEVDYDSKCAALRADYNLKLKEVIGADYWSKCDALWVEYTNLLRKLVPTSFFF